MAVTRNQGSASSQNKEHERTNSCTNGEEQFPLLLMSKDSAPPTPTSPDLAPSHTPASSPPRPRSPDATRTGATQVSVSSRLNSPGLISPAPPARNPIMSPASIGSSAPSTPRRSFAPHLASPVFLRSSIRNTTPFTYNRFNLRKPSANHKKREFMQPKEPLHKTGKNFQAWKQLMKLALSQYPWKELISHPFSLSDLQAYGFEDEDEEVRQYIMFSIEPAIVEALGEPLTAYATWKALCDRYESRLDPDDAEWELYSYRIKDTDSVKQHLERMDQLKLNFERVGGHLDEEKWLRVLKRSFASDNRTELTLDARRSEHKNVKDFEIYMKKRDDVPWKSTTTSAPSRSLSRQRSTPNMRQCDNCKRTNHSTNQCHYENGAEERKCKNCSLFGHTKETCFRPGGDANKSPAPAHQKAKLAMSDADELKLLRAELSRLKDENRLLRVPADPVLGTAKLATGPRLDVKGQSEKLATPRGHKSSTFILDTGATAHLVSDRSLFVTYEPRDGTVQTADEKGSMKVIGFGLIRVYGCMEVGEPWHALSFEAYHCPDLASNLLSVSRIFDEFKGRIRLEESFADLMNSDDHPVARATRVANLWTFNFVSEFNELAVLTIGPRSTSRSATLSDIHRAASHINPGLIKEAIQSGRVLGIDLKADKGEIEPCEACVEGKMTKSVSPSKPLYASRIGHLLHADILHFEIASVSGFRMALTLEDTFSSFRWAFPMKTKDAETVLTHWSSVVRFLSLRGFPVLELQTDNGSEFCNIHMSSFNESLAILHRKSVPYAHEMNGRIERTNRTLQEGIRANLFTTHMPLRYWAEALSHFLYTLNRFARSKDVNKSPFQLMFGYAPNVGHLLPFGQPVYYFVPPELRKKLEEKARFGRILGYEEDASYRVLLPHAEVIVSRDIRCLPLHYQPQALKPSSLSHTSHPTPSSNQLLPEPVPEHPRRSSRVPKPSLKVLESQDSASLVQVQPRPIPKNLRDALNGPDALKWREAITAENEVLREMKVFTLREALPNDKPLPGTLVYTRKQMDSGDERFKVRFCIRGDLQVPGRDFDETFAQAGDMTGYKLVAALSTLPNASPQALDIKGAFLTAPMDDQTVCVNLPPLYEAPGFIKPVAILNKALYGLRQAPRLFRRHLVDKMALSGYTPLKSNPTLFSKPSLEGETVAVASFWVDDGFAAQWDRALNGHAQEEQCGFIEDVKKHFQLKVKDLTAGSTIVGMHMRWYPDNKRIRLSVKDKILAIAERFGLSNANTANTPMQSDAMRVFEMDTSNIDVDFPYRELIGSLLWLGTVARPDITFAVNALSRFCDKARSSQVIAVKRIVRYLLKTQDLALEYGKHPTSPQSLAGFSDADWAGDLGDRKSTSGYVIMVNGVAISWRSRKQQAVAKSTAEAEYVAASECATEVEWFRAMFAELNLKSIAQSTPTPLFVDNQAAIQMTENDIHMSRAKAIDIKFHHIKDLVQKGEIVVSKIAGVDNPADIFTKPLPPISHYKCVALLGLS